MNTQTLNISTDSAVSRPVRLLKQAGISLNGIRRQLGIGKADRVKQALDPHEYLRVRHGELRRIHRRVEELLDAAGYDTADLWDEFADDQEDAA